MARQQRVVRGIAGIGLMIALLMTGACDVAKENLLAPSDAVLTIKSEASFLASSSSTRLTVQLKKLDGQPAANGTEIVLTASSGELDQRKVKISNGEASVTYRAGATAGTVRIQASSGSVTAELSLLVGSAPPGSLTLVANPTVLSPGGGDAEVVATVSAPNGALVVGAPVTFSTSAGTVSPTEVVTNERGEARTTLRTSSTSTVSAKVPGYETSTLVRVRLSITLQVSTNPSQPTATEAASIVTTARTSDGQPATGRLRLSFGDGQSRDLGLFTGSSTTSYTWTKEGTYSLTADFTDADAVITRVSNTVSVKAKPVVTPPPTTPPTTPPSTGGGTRTPDPPPGQRLPLPNMSWVVDEVARNYPSALRNSCQDHGGSWEFMDRVVDRLRQFDTRWGYNCKRGNCGDPSHDVVDYNFGSGRDEGTTNVYIIDIIAGHCGSSPSPAWIDVTRDTANAGTIGRWTGRGRF